MEPVTIGMIPRKAHEDRGPTNARDTTRIPRTTRTMRSTFPMFFFKAASPAGGLRPASHPET